jgi:hypothetical protein
MTPGARSERRWPPRGKEGGLNAGEPEFFPLRAPETSDVQKVVEAVACGISALMKRRELAGGAGDEEDSDKLVREDPWLAGILAASVSAEPNIRLPGTGLQGQTSSLLKHNVIFITI